MLHTASASPAEVFSTKSRDTFPVKLPGMCFAFAKVKAQESCLSTETWHSFFASFSHVIQKQSLSCFIQLVISILNKIPTRKTSTETVEIRMHVFHRLKYSESKPLKDTIRNRKLLMENCQMDREETKCALSPLLPIFSLVWCTPLSSSPKRLI